MAAALLLPALGPAAEPQNSPAPKKNSAADPVILVLGDSLSAAYGLPAAQGWTALLQQRLAAQGYPHRVVNASISGDTTQGGLARLPAALQQHRPHLVLIELGGNDGLRALPVKKLRDNLRQMVRLARAAGAVPVLFEMRIPANYGAEYTLQFERSFAEVARTEDVALAPFILGGFAQDPRAFQDDGIHPNAAQQPQMLDAVWPAIQRQLKASIRAAKP